MTTLHHLALGARDVEKVTAFYRDVLGLREQKRHLQADGSVRSIWLDLGNATLMIERSEAKPHVVDTLGAGLFLLAIRVSADERTRLEEAMERAGSRIENRTQFTSYARDPEGNRVAISHHPLVGA